MAAAITASDRDIAATQAFRHYQAAVDRRNHRGPVDEVISTYSDWIRMFAPDEAEALIAQFRRKLAWGRP